MPPWFVMTAALDKSPVFAEDLIQYMIGTVYIVT